MMKKLRQKLSKRRVIIPISVILIIILAAGVVYAATDADWYQNNRDILSQHDIVESAIRWIGWGFLSLVVTLCNGCQTLYDKAFTFVDVTNYTVVREFMESFKPVVIALMALSLLFLGFMLMMEHEKKPKIMINICIAFLCVTSSSLIFSTLNSWTISLKNEINGGNPTSAAYEVINNNISDLVYLHYQHSGGLSDVNWAASPEWGTKLTTKKDFDNIDFTEVLNPKSEKYDWSKGGTKDILSKYCYMVPADGDSNKMTPELGDVDNGFGWNSADDADIGNTFYYRYHFRFLEAIIQLFALIIIYITMSYKVIRVTFELVVARLFAYLYSAELSGGEKIKKILVFIRDSYILLVVTAICIRVYLLLNNVLSQLADSKSWPALVVAFFSLFLAFAVIDGPNLVEKLLGMDAGLKSSTARMLAIGRAASGFGKAAGGVAAGASAKNIANKVNNVKSGEISKGGLAAGAYGAAFGKAMTDGEAKTASTSERVGGLKGMTPAEKQQKAMAREASGGWGGSNGFNESAGGQATAYSSSEGTSGGGYSGSSGGSAYSGGFSSGSSGSAAFIGATSGGSQSTTYQGASSDKNSSSKGEKGEAGRDGQKGDQGQKGDKGDRGYHGLEGKEGKVGEQGKEGTQKEGFKDKADKPSSQNAQNNPFEAKPEKGERRSFMDQGTKSSSGTTPSSGSYSSGNNYSGIQAQSNGNNFMNGGDKNGNKDNNSKYRK